MSEVRLGELGIEHYGCRDAVHIPILLRKASEMLRPGQRVGIVSEGIVGPSADIIGIVDPFLTDVVPKGGFFWLCLLPGTVTGMRHHWFHPAFDKPVDDRKADAEAWLMAQCEPLGCDFEDLVGPNSDLVCGEFILSGKNENARDHWCAIQDEFWRQRLIYTGEDVPKKNRGGFTCDC